MSKDSTILIYVQDYAREDNLSNYNREDDNMPLGILYLGSYLDRHRYKVKLLDTRLCSKEDFFKSLHEKLSNCILVGLSVMTPCISNALEISRFIKSLAPQAKIIWGGAHPTLFPESTIRNEYIDFVMLKEGEKGLLALVRYLLEGHPDISQIPNLVFIEDNKVKKNTIEIEEELGFIGLPSYELLDIERYINRSIDLGYIRRQAEVLTSRGCPHRCAFCINPIVYKCRWRSEPLEQTTKNLDYLIERYKVQHIFFMDEDLFCNRDRIKNLIEIVKERNITWEGNCRVDDVDEDILKHLKESGCVKLRFGLESGSQRILNLLKKDFTIGQSIDAVRKVTQNKILPSVSFMVGLPGETINDIARTMELILQLFKINPDINIIGPLIYRPYPGCELFRICAEKGLVVPETLNEWSNFHIHNLLEEYRGDLPWFTYAYILRRVLILGAYFHFSQRARRFKGLIQKLIKFHIVTKFKFIYIDYSFYRFIKKSVKIVLD